MRVVDLEDHAFGPGEVKSELAFRKSMGWLVETAAARKALGGCTRQNVYRLIESGRLRACKINGKVHVSLRDCEDYESSERQKGGRPKRGSGCAGAGMTLAAVSG